VIISYILKVVFGLQATVVLPTDVRKLLVTHSNSNEVEIVGAKGPVFATAVIAGVMAAKKTSDLIPFCHPVSLEDCVINIRMDEHDENSVVIDCTTKTTHKTGVEMEALVGVTNAALCIYDMLKAVSHDIRIVDVKLMEKTGGKSDFKR
jgi:cyclic pyranopterin phosphate synthase